MSGLSTAFCNITRPRILRVAAVIIAAAWLGSFVFWQIQADGNLDRRGKVLGGDFLAFYGAGRLVLQGRGSELYDGEAQQQVQEPVAGRARGLYYFINPAPYALIHAPLALLPFRLAFLLHTALMLLAALAGLSAMRRQLPTHGRFWGTTLLLSVSSFPLVHTIMGGQNAALALALFCAALAALQAGHPVRAGVSLGLLLYKPQYALTLLLLLAIRRRWRAVGTAGLVGLGLYVAGALCCGWGWPLRMLQATGGFYRAHERVANGPTLIALLEALDWSVVLPLEQAGAAGLARAVQVLGWVAVTGLLAWLIHSWRDAEPGTPRFRLHFALAGAVTVITALHAQYYDAALLLPSVLLLTEHHSEPPRALGGGARAVLVLVYVLFPLLILGRLSLLLRFQPALLIPIGVAWWAARSLRRARRDALG